MFYQYKIEKKTSCKNNILIKKIKYKDYILIKNLNSYNIIENTSNYNMFIWKINIKKTTINNINLNKKTKKNSYKTTIKTKTKNIKTSIYIKKINNRYKYIIKNIKYYKYKIDKPIYVKSPNNYTKISQIKLTDKNTKSIMIIKINIKLKNNIFGNIYIYTADLDIPEINFINKNIYIKIKIRDILLINTKNIVK